MKEWDDSKVAIAYALLLRIAVLPRLECFAVVADGGKCRGFVFYGQHCRLKIERCITLQFAIFLKVKALGFFLTVFIEDIAYAGLVAILSVAIQIKEILGGLGSTEQVFLGQEVEHLPTLVGLTGHTTA